MVTLEIAAKKVDIFFSNLEKSKGNCCEEKPWKQTVILSKGLRPPACNKLIILGLIAANV